MRPLPRPARLALLPVLAALAFLPPRSHAAESAGAGLRDALRPLESRLTTGVLYDRVLPIARLDRLDGGAQAPPVSRGLWRQAFDELRRAANAPDALPGIERIDATARAVALRGRVPIAILDREYERLSPERARGASPQEIAARVAAGAPGLVERRRAFVAAALAPRTFRGAAVDFEIPPGLVFTDEPRPRSIEVDFDDGRGLRPVRVGASTRVHYASPGSRTLTVRLVRADGSLAESRTPFEVAGLATPAPDDTLPITASVAHQGVFGTGDAYVYLAPGRTAIENPVVVIEGFDLDNSMNWDELYALLNQENLIETLRADGFDAVVLNFTDSTEPIQRNGLVVAELLQQVEAAIAPSATVALVGASMGGLCSRYALDWLESNAIPHRVRTWISFDVPHGGAVIPLGLQYWIEFFADQSTEAADFLAILNRPAARQMLVYHYTNPAGATGEADPLRPAMLADFAGLGDWPALTRRVAVANGSGAGTNQGFAPGAQVIRWDYTSTFVDVRGNVFALPHPGADTIFAGRTRAVFIVTTKNVIVSGTQPWDGAPGGSRSSFADLDALTAPYGDILALHPNHCFIPTVSALALPTGDPFFDVDGTPDLVSLTPFDAVYFPAANEPHVMITPANAQWVRDEIGAGTVSVPGGRPLAATGGLELALAPNPFASGLAIRFSLDRASRVDLRIFGVDGRQVRGIAAGELAPGPQGLRWDGRDDSGSPVPAGLYFVRLSAGSNSATGRAALIR